MTKPLNQCTDVSVMKGQKWDQSIPVFKSIARYYDTDGFTLISKKKMFNDVPLPRSEGQKRYQGFQLSPLLWKFAAVGKRY